MIQTLRKENNCVPIIFIFEHKKYEMTIIQEEYVSVINYLH